jgi:tetratricopeptide (TPR) repeat protein
LSTKRLLLALALVLGLFAVASPQAAAAPNPSDEGCNQDDECRGHFITAKALYKQQDYTNALQEFQTAYKRRQTPILLANIGRTLHKLGRPKEALDYYRQCQEAAKSDLDLQEKLKTYIAEANALLSAAPPPPPAEVKEPEPSPLVVPAAPVDMPKPVYKKGWFWAVIGVSAAVVVGGVVTGVVLGTRAQSMPDPPLDPSVTVIRPMF